MTNDGLIELRKQILEQATPLLNVSDLPAEEKFRLSLQIAQSQGTLEAYTQAFQSAQSFDNANDKLSALLDLLGEVDFAIQDSMEAVAEEELSAPADASPSEILEQASGN